MEVLPVTTITDKVWGPHTDPQTAASFLHQQGYEATICDGQRRFYWPRFDYWLPALAYPGAWEFLKNMQQALAQSELAR